MVGSAVVDDQHVDRVHGVVQPAQALEALAEMVRPAKRWNDDGVARACHARPSASASWNSCSCHHAIVRSRPLFKSYLGRQPSVLVRRVVSATTRGLSDGAAGMAPKRIKSGRPSKA